MPLSRRWCKHPPGAAAGDHVMHLIVAGLNHKTAPVRVREQCAFSAAQRHTICRELLREEGIDGVLILTTCNRTEIYATVRENDEGFEVIERAMAQYAGIERRALSGCLYRYDDHRTVSHLFAVAAGLDSMVLGEQEILGQIREAYRTACAARAPDSLLHALFQTAVHVGKKVRTETGISRYPVSVSSVAVELCRGIFTSLDEKHVLVVGAGDAGTRAVATLMENGAASVIVSNRSYDHAVAMAAAVGGRAVHFDAIAAEIAAADIVISCTAAPHPVIRSDNCGRALRGRNGRDIVLIDIAMPRDVDPALADIPGVFLYDIDDLQNVVSRNHKERLDAARRARGIIEQEAVRFVEKLSSLPVVPIISSLKQYADDIARDELSKALRKIGHATDDQKRAAVLAALANGIAARLVHAPIAKLKEKSFSGRGRDYSDVVRELFDLRIHDDNPQDQTRHARQ